MDVIWLQSLCCNLGLQSDSEESEVSPNSTLEWHIAGLGPALSPTLESVKVTPKYLDTTIRSMEIVLKGT